MILHKFKFFYSRSIVLNSWYITNSKSCGIIHNGRRDRQRKCRRHQILRSNNKSNGSRCNLSQESQHLPPNSSYCRSRCCKFYVVVFDIFSTYDRKFNLFFENSWLVVQMLKYWFTCIFIYSMYLLRLTNNCISWIISNLYQYCFTIWKGTE